ncbi:hypothetical protein FRB90_000861 [Tulasnella sp. 427]|nr:hypothetical protein FRB90_000861 [Tulasnella sp. 427]
MPAKRGSKCVKNLGAYARKRVQVEETEASEESELAEPTLPVAETELPALWDSGDESSDSEEDEDDANDLVMGTDEDVQMLFSQLENHFAKTL